MKLTKKQKGFANDYMETGNATEAVINNYDVKDRIVAKSVGSENLTKPNIIAYLQGEAEPVAKNMIRLALNAESEQVQVSAGKDVLDRAGYKPVEQTLNMNVTIKSIDPTDETILNSLKAIQEKLENQ